jgi:hypothetical protein
MAMSYGPMAMSSSTLLSVSCSHMVTLLVKKSRGSGWVILQRKINRIAQFIQEVYIGKSMPETADSIEPYISYVFHIYIYIVPIKINL